MSKRMEALARLVSAVEAGADVCIQQKKGSGTYQVTLSNDRIAVVATSSELEQAAKDSAADWERQHRLEDTRPDIKAMR